MNVVYYKKIPLVSALGVIPKKNSKVRLIHDCSQPAGSGVNDYAVENKFKYQTLNDAMEMVEPGDFLAKNDLQSTYCSVQVSTEECQRLGISWWFECAVHPPYIVDACLLFGHSRSSYFFNELSQAVCRIMKVYGFEQVMAYLDDFLNIANKSYDGFKQALNFLLFILRRLILAYHTQKWRYQFRGSCSLASKLILLK